MQELLFAGARGVIEDSVADALLDYAAALADFRRTDVVDVPLRVDGRDTWARLLLTTHPSLGVVGTGGGDTAVPGSAEAVAELRLRLVALTAPMDLSQMTDDDLLLEFEA